MRSFIKRAIPKTLRKRIEHAEKMQLAHIVPLIWVAGSWIRPERRRLPRLPPNSKNDPLEPQSEAKGVKMDAKSMKIRWTPRMFWILTFRFVGVPGYPPLKIDENQ